MMYFEFTTLEKAAECGKARQEELQSVAGHLWAGAHRGWPSGRRHAVLQMAVVDRGQNFLFAVQQVHLPLTPKPHLDFATSLPARRIVPSHAFVAHHILLLIECESDVVKRIAIIDGNPALPEGDATAIVGSHPQHLRR